MEVSLKNLDYITRVHSHMVSNKSVRKERFVPFSFPIKIPQEFPVIEVIKDIDHHPVIYQWPVEFVGNYSRVDNKVMYFFSPHCRYTPLPKFMFSIGIDTPRIARRGTITEYLLININALQVTLQGISRAIINSTGKTSDSEKIPEIAVFHSCR